MHFLVLPLILLILDWINSPQDIYEESNLNFSYVRLCDLDIPIEKMAELFANSGDPDLMLQHLMCVCTVCQLPFWESPDIKVLMSKNVLTIMF